MVLRQMTQKFNDKAEADNGKHAGETRQKVMLQGACLSSTGKTFTMRSESLSAVNCQAAVL